MATLFNGMKQSEFLNELVSATGLNGKELLDFLLDRINLDNTDGKATAMQKVSTNRDDKGMNDFLDLCYSDTDKFTASLVMQREFNRYNFTMGDVSALSASKFMCKCPTSSFSMTVECGVKGYIPAHIKIYHPFNTYSGPNITMLYGVMCDHYIVRSISDYENN